MSVKTLQKKCLRLRGISSIGQPVLLWSASNKSASSSPWKSKTSERCCWSHPRSPTCWSAPLSSTHWSRRSRKRRRRGWRRKNWNCGRSITSVAKNSMRSATTSCGRFLTKPASSGSSTALSSSSPPSSQLSVRLAILSLPSKHPALVNRSGTYRLLKLIYLPNVRPFLLNIYVNGHFITQVSFYVVSRFPLV